MNEKELREYEELEHRKELLRLAVLGSYYSKSNIVTIDAIEDARRDLGMPKEAVNELDELCKTYNFIDKVEQGYSLDAKFIRVYKEELLVRDETLRMNSDETLRMNAMCKTLRVWKLCEL